MLDSLSLDAIPESVYVAMGERGALLPAEDVFGERALGIRPLQYSLHELQTLAISGMHFHWYIIKACSAALH